MIARTTNRWMHGILGRVLMGLGLLLVGAAMAHWCWNVIGHELFGGPKSEYRHGVAMMAALIMIAWTFRIARHRNAANQRHS